MLASELPLRGIHIPEAITGWPPAVGWWLLIALVIVLGWLGGWFYRRSLTANSAVKSARKILAELKQSTHLSTTEKLAQLSILLRRTAISLAADKKVAGLTGQAWLAYLDKTMTATPFTDSVGYLLVEFAYRKSPPVPAELDRLFACCERWLETCHKLPRDEKNP